MNFEETDSNLLITVSKDERETLRQWSEDEAVSLNCDEIMCEWFDSYLAKTEYDWTDRIDMMGVTDAPTLCSVNDPFKRFCFMSYRIDSVLGRLLHEGYVLFMGISRTSPGNDLTYTMDEVDS